MRDPLTYKYPRTLVEAFGCDAQSANPIEGPFKSEWGWLTDVLITLVVIVIFSWVVYHYFGG